MGRIPLHFKILIGAVLLATISFFIYNSIFSISTDDASVEAHFTTVHSKLSGYIDKIVVEEGADVSAGDTLGEFNKKSFFAALKAAQSKVEDEQAKLNDDQAAMTKAEASQGTRAEKRARIHEITKKMEQDTAGFKAAQQELKSAQTVLANTKIVAPIAGTVRRIAAAPGTAITTGEEVATLVADNAFSVIAHFADTDIDRVEIGAYANIRIEGTGWGNLEGMVETVHRRLTPTFPTFPPEAAGPGLSKNSPRAYVKIRLFNLSRGDKLRLKAGIPVTVSVRGK